MFRYHRLRPYIGTKTEAGNKVLKNGEMFFEVPDTGIGTGAGKIKIGDGKTAYPDLPYFIGSDSSSESDNKNEGEGNTPSTPNTPSTNDGETIGSN